MTGRGPAAAILAPIVVTAAIVVLWDLVVLATGLSRFILPRPGEVAASLAAFWPAILDNALFTFQTTLIGLALAIVFGAVCGVLIGASRWARAALEPLLVAFNSVPKVAVVPVLVIWFGVGAVPAVLTAFLIAFFPIAVNVAAGIAQVEPELRDVLRALGASERQILLKIGLPRALPMFFASLKIAATLAFVGAVIAETVASNKGVGNLMLTASSSFDVPLVFAGLVVIAAMGVALYVAAQLVEIRLTRWTRR